jgi:peptide/nickel transport system substrate-binding protein
MGFETHSILKRHVSLAAVLALVATVALLASTTAQSPKSVTIALAREPDRLYRPASMADQLVANLVFDPLVGLDDQMHPYPVLAAEIPGPENGLVQLSGDGADRRLVVTMPLRQDVTWSDGERFTADDVVYTWQLMMNPRSGFDTTVEDKLKSVDKVDTFTVRFTYMSANEARAFDPERYQNQGNEPVVDPLYPFGLYGAPAIYPRHRLREIVGDDPRHSPAVEALETSAFARAPVGTGPYVLATWEPGLGISFASRGALSHRGRAPAIEQVTFRIMPDKNDSLAALTAGQIHVVTQDTLDAGDAPILDTIPGVQARYTPGNAWEHLTFNLDHPALGDQAVRHAIGHAINRPALNEAILFGKGEVAISHVPSWSWAFEPRVRAFDYNPPLADLILDQAGWTRGQGGVREKAGQRLSLKFWSTPAAFRPGLMAMVKDQLAQVGIELSIDVFPSAVLFELTPTSPQALVGRQFDIVEFAWVNAYDPGLDAVYSMHSTAVPARANAFRGGNYAGYKNPRSDELLDQVQRSLDPGFRRVALAEVQMIWQDDLPVLPLLLRPITTATSARLQNFRPTPAPAGETWNIEQWDLSSP